MNCQICSQPYKYAGKYTLCAFHYRMLQQYKKGKALVKEALLSGLNKLR